MSSAPTRVFQVRQGEGAAGANLDLGSSLSQAINDALERNGPKGFFRTCGSCVHMNRGQDQRAFCNKWKMVPPVAIILSACDAFEDDQDIPF